MAHLPPVGWADVATKHDLEQLEGRMILRFEALEERMDGKLHRLEARIMRTLALTNSASILTVAALAFGAAKLV